ncbi:MAG: DUF4278 domain-containing protein [Cyanobacteriota bacterium]|jgi:hypothetical protein
MANSLRYRGVSYDPAAHEQPSDRPVTHTYRGRAYLAPLHHLVDPTPIQEELRYRGHGYRSHRSQGRDS